MNPCELTMSITALANAISRGLSDDDLNLASTIFLQLGDTLAVISAQRDRCRNLESGNQASGAGGGQESQSDLE
ncbi:MAG: hypothetical protein FWF05_03645 [Oscillospiraceae bacterium]|nr:hypothetical protein [Oscillospiraceae bacterium]